MSRKQFAQVPHPSFPRGLNGKPVMMDMSGWCQVCGTYLERRSPDHPIFDPGTVRPHTHPVPWRLGPKPRREKQP